ncbi:MdtA/MuxA family multidrug efflux RND transporter periplasmic adaptor subunit [Pseudomonas sp. CR3202]|uniref:MdtA/MuxA family multidrug efflux RND transporter periplasmic adaptor subunit n=1 Tax=Pseudomonas sp. CR3202 TaxID=3351532 RepID=UPI003BF1E2BE
MNQPLPATPHFSPRHRWRWLGALPAAVAAGLWWWSGSAAQPAAAPARQGAELAVPVATTEAHSGSLTLSLDALGSVVPANSVLVRPRVDGQLLRLHFTEGQQVKAGQLLAEIDPRPFEVMLTQARGQLIKDEALLMHARLDLQRYRELWRREAIARQLLDAQEALVQQYEGQVEASRSQVDNARLQLDYARVTAPITGRVGLRLVDPGNVVQANDTSGLVRITQLQPMHVLFTLPEDALPRLLPRLASGKRLVVEAYDRSLRERLALGELQSLDNQIDASSGTVKLKAEFANADGALFPNQFVNVRLGLETLENAVLLPTEAIQRGTDGTFVYALDDQNRVRRQAVVLGAADAGRVAVENGVRAGDRVVLDGIDRLRSGTLVAPQADTLSRTVQLPTP